MDYTDMPRINLKLIIMTVLVSLGFFLSKPSGIFAAKKFGVKAGVYRTGPSAIPAVVRYRPDRQGILMSFLNFNGIDSVSYLFTYSTNGTPEGAAGTVTANNDPTSDRELLFGTCSRGVCTYHYNLANARLVLHAKMTNGTTVTKSYRIKTYQ